MWFQKITTPPRWRVTERGGGWGVRKEGACAMGAILFIMHIMPPPPIEGVGIPVGREVSQSVPLIFLTKWSIFQGEIVSAL